jgi:hypothetical protein
MKGKSRAMRVGSFGHAESGLKFVFGSFECMGVDKNNLPVLPVLAVDQGFKREDDAAITR